MFALLVKFEYSKAYEIFGLVPKLRISQVLNSTNNTDSDLNFRSCECRGSHSVSTIHIFGAVKSSDASENVHSNLLSILCADVEKGCSFS